MSTVAKPVSEEDIKKAMAAMMTMIKLDIAALQRAYDGE